MHAYVWKCDHPNWDEVCTKRYEFSCGMQRIGFVWIWSDNWTIILIRSDFSFNGSIFCICMDEKELEILENDINGIIE